ncbi:MAG: extracellular solute-binding protein [Candidatus Vecturithrix sp.]|jgi:ABC-type glycerol-3-phosphate transport system substrate-binding protein|nr:extracellular solute-binding protein [Candidatus Vecturithrix sp.]
MKNRSLWIMLLITMIALHVSAAEITVTYMQSGTYDKAAEKIKADFESNAGITVELVFAPWAVLNQNHITDLTTGTGEFDVMSGEFWIASVFEHMLPLDEFAARDNYGDTFIERIWSPGPSNFYGGKRIGVPYSADAYGILYRIDLFEKYGIDADWQTWDDFIDRLAKLKDALAGTDIAANVYAWGAPEQNPSIFLGMYDGYLVNKDGTYELEKDKAVAALQKMADLLQYNPSNAVGLSIDEANAVFLDGKAATLMGWPSFVRAAADDPDKSKVVGNWRLAHFPGPGFPMVSAWNLFISKYSDNPEESWKWIKAYSNPERAKEFMLEFGIGSPHRLTYEDEELLKQHAHDYPGQLDNLSRAKSLPWTFEAFEIFFRNTGELMIGSITPEQVVKNSHAAWAEIKVPTALIEIADAQGLKQK